MHPAYSIILFTVASGTGYGFLALMGVLGALGLLPAERWLGGIGLGFALAAVTLGLLSSTLHLSHPERAWRALTQVRSSWLSREGALALLTYPLALIFAYGWVVLGRTDGPWALAGIAAAIGAALTVACTAMIYASLKPVHQWRNRWVPANYLALAAMSGALWLNALMHGLGAAGPGMAAMSLGLLSLALVLKGAYWRFIDRTASPATPGTATGLGAIGAVRLLDAPHTQANYLMREMGFAVARKHARRLRGITVIAGFALPAILVLAALALPFWPATAAAILAAIIGALGILTERWLFFAEAKHTVMLYYGAGSA
ncbi:MAG: dimethyl sulfoxide reductase anchor subunit family protein [Alphaproteobacteria bacterium]